MTITLKQKRPLLGLLTVALLTGAAPVLAQKASTAADAEVRLRKLEAEMKAVQRQVFPGGDGKYFPPAVDTAASAATPAGTPATTPVTDLLTRMDSVEAQLTRLTAQAEENGNRIAQLEARLTALTPVPVPAPAGVDVPASPATTAPSTPALVPAAKPAEQAPKPAITSANLAPPPEKTQPAATPLAAQPAAAQSAATKPAATKTAVAPAKPEAPSAKRVAAVKAIEKPATVDPGDDEYSYGYRLWDAKFYPEAEQQLQLFITKYPKHSRISFGRNLLGRAYLDDGKPRDAAQWFLKNYQADKKGARAPDSLLLLAESMRQLKDVKRACIALGEFADGYPAEAAGRLKGQYDEVRSGVKCN